MKRTKCIHCGEFVEMKLVVIVLKTKDNEQIKGFSDVCPACDTEQHIVPPDINFFAVPDPELKTGLTKNADIYDPDANKDDTDTYFKRRLNPDDN